MRFAQFIKLALAPLLLPFLFGVLPPTALAAGAGNAEEEDPLADLTDEELDMIIDTGVVFGAGTTPKGFWAVEVTPALGHDDNPAAGPEPDGSLFSGGTFLAFGQKNFKASDLKWVLSSDYFYFPDVDEGIKEATALSRVEWLGAEGKLGRFGLALTYFYLNSPVKLSSADLSVETSRILEVHQAELRGLWKSPHTGRRWMAEAAVARAWYIDGNNDAYDVEMIVGWETDGPGESVFSIEAEASSRLFVQRDSRNAIGAIIEDDTLGWNQVDLTASWKDYDLKWVPVGATTELSLKARQDTAVGFDDYLRWKLRQRLDYDADRLGLAASFSLSNFDYANRRSAGATVADSWLSQWSFTVDATYELSSMFSILMTYRHQDLVADLRDKSYRSNRYLLGMSVFW